MLMSNEQGSKRAAQEDFTRSGWRQFMRLNRSLGARFLRGFVLRYELAAYLTAHEAAGAELDEGCQEVCYENGVYLLLRKMQGMWYITDIFATEGEAYFRQCETDMLDELGTMEPSIISCGGGMALREINRRKLKAMGEVVLLQASPETILERVKDSTNRPILNGNMNIAFISDLMGKRLPAYEKAATVKISTDGKTVTEIAKEILEKTHQI